MENEEQEHNSEADGDNEQNVEDSDLTTLTLNEVLQYEADMIEDTAAVLGALNDKICSYSEGYLKRQALYSCITCIPESKTDQDKRAGICLACSYDCHDGHDLIELYTKRNFRCDCGNSKFGSMKCNLFENKEPLNVENSYNHNFQGTYCVCSRPYPDPDDTVNDEMIQCIVCEDWYHSRHLNASLPSTPFAEMICFTCVREHEFLSHYVDFSMMKTENSVENSEIDDSKKESNTEKPIPSEDSCKKPKVRIESSTLFFADISWRDSLCTCDVCLEMYGDENVLFLVDSEDPVQVYEEKGKAKTQEIIEAQDKNLIGSINSMDRVQLVETIAGYNEFKSDLAEFFRGFAEKKKVIREEDVKEFFEEMQAKKKRRTDNMSYFCR